jgi:glutathione S-transferase
VKLFWSTRSPFVRFVMVVAHEKGLAEQIELEQVVVAAARPNADVMAKNGLNKLPTLILSDGSALYDSRVICEYFDATGSGTKLYPQPGDDRWDTLRRQAQSVGLLDLLVSWLPEHRKPAGEQDPDLVAALLLKFNSVLDELDQDAERVSHLPFDAGHAALGAALGYADFRYDDLKWRVGRLGLGGLYDDLKDRPSFQATQHRDEY